MIDRSVFDQQRWRAMPLFRGVRAKFLGILLSRVLDNNTCEPYDRTAPWREHAQMYLKGQPPAFRN